MELVKLEVPLYLAAIIKKIHEVEADFINIRFNINTDLKELDFSLEDFHILMDRFRAVRERYINLIPLEKRSMNINVDARGDYYLFEMTYFWTLSREYPEAREVMRSLKKIITKYRGTMQVEFPGEDSTVLTLMLPKS